ncbi:restriction endonuclease subunit S [Nitrospina watsonii]|uniref:Type I site-specific deoxyribonuclease n=1 Tax=Nitrospina watsonii TaxID=1323948 RepID=A0ABM9HBI9_9BACT|nr:restriction endonuclease subunit S [Nitrospina watsonii]CAI2717522.1 putative Type I site-specific deoxyribonuclease [Nitrospina watsonii]
MREEIQIPETWSKCQIEEITLPVAKINQKENPDQQIEYIDISGIDNLRNKIGETKQYCIGEAPSRARQIVQEGDVLFSTVRPYLRNIAAVPEKYNGQIASTGFSVLRPAKGIAPLYLFYNCIYIDFVNALSGEQYGVSYPAVKDEQVRGKRINLPPTNEQKRIVAKIEELFSELDKGIENLKTAWEQLKAYRQAVLKHAFEGKLTAQWREENKDKLKTVDVLLEDIKTEREDHIKKLSKKRVKSPRDFKDEDFSWLPELPDGWTWERLGWVTSGVEYGTSAKSSKEGDIPVLRMGNIQKAKLDWGDLVYTSDKEEIEKYSLNKGDVLFNRTNSPELVGKAAIYRNENPAIFAGYLIRLNHIETIVDSQYLNFFLNSHVAKQYGNRVKTDGVNQSNINGEKLINYPFPYCSLDEQKQIVERLDERITELDRTENDIVEQLQKAEALRQSILRQAFSGKLAAQDPNDEPTSVLLECIKAEKNGIKKKRNAA